MPTINDMDTWRVETLKYIARLQAATNDALDEARKARPRATNVTWGDLSCSMAECCLTHDDVEYYRVLIDGAAPSADELRMFIGEFLEGRGFANIQVDTRW